VDRDPPPRLIERRERARRDRGLMSRAVRARKPSRSYGRREGRELHASGWGDPELISTLSKPVLVGAMKRRV